VTTLGGVYEYLRDLLREEAGFLEGETEKKPRKDVIAASEFMKKRSDCLAREKLDEGSSTPLRARSLEKRKEMLVGREDGGGGNR